MIDNGMGQIRRLQTKANSRIKARTAREPYNRLSMLLWNIPGQDKGKVQQICNDLERMNTQERQDTIRQHFGQAVLDKCQSTIEYLEKQGL